MKICIRCNKHEAIRDRPAWCGECKRSYDRKYYQKTKLLRQKQKQNNSARIRDRNRLYIIDYLSSHPCIDCGESDTVVLEFDHFRDKTYDVAELSGRCVSLATLQEEINKCEVRCANCHRRKTAKQFNWHAYL